MYESESHSRGIQLMWSTSYFARFAFDIIALLNGKYSSGELSALHGLINEHDLQCDEDSDTEYVESHKRH